MIETEYLEERLNSEIAWYSQRSRINQHWYRVTQIIQIVFAAFIPFIAGFGADVPFYKILMGGLGMVVAISAGISSLYKFQENWIEYRTTAEMLKHEKYLFETKSSPYHDADAFEKLVVHVEGIISKENSKWSTHIQEKEES